MPSIDIYWIDARGRQCRSDWYRLRNAAYTAGVPMILIWRHWVRAHPLAWVTA